MLRWFCLQRVYLLRNPMKKYTQIAKNAHIFNNICIKIQIEPKEKRNRCYVWQFLALTENPHRV